MDLKYCAWFVFLICGVFESVYPTGILFNAIKKSVQGTRCKLHILGSKIVGHHHHFGGPCVQQEAQYEYHGNNGNYEFGPENGYPVHENNFGNPESWNPYGNGNGHHGYNFQGTSSGITIMPFEHERSNPSTTESNKQITGTFGQGSGNGNYDTSSKGPNENVDDNATIEKNIEDIFGKPDGGLKLVDNSIDGDGSAGSGSTLKVTSEIYPSSLDIDVRLASEDNVKSTTRNHVPEPTGGGRHIFRGSACPDGTTPTKDGCMEEI